MKGLLTAALFVPLVVGSCDRDPVSPDLLLPTDFVVSNPKLVTAVSSSARETASISVADERIVYVSLPPRTFAD